VVEEDLPSDQKKAAACRGLVLFGDEASFWLDGTLHQTWSRIGEQPRVDTYGERKTAHLFGAVSLTDARFTYQFADVFNGNTFWRFLRLLVRRYRGRKVFLILDNGPCHNLKADGIRWLRENSHRISLHRLPPYSPEFNPVEPIWKTTRKLATHNRFYQTTIERDTALRRAFQRFYANPALIRAHVARFR
jgi:transposase